LIGKLSKQEVILRRAKESDAEKILDLLLRLKRLNEEFDPLYKVAEDASTVGIKYVRDAINSDDCLVVVAQHGTKIVGVIKVDFRKRIFYEPRSDAHIVDLYVMPEYRRNKYGQKLIDYVMKEAKDHGGIVTVEFPSANKISTDFYEKLGFRPILNTYVRHPVE